MLRIILFPGALVVGVCAVPLLHLSWIAGQLWWQERFDDEPPFLEHLIQFGPWYLSPETACLAAAAAGGVLVLTSLWLASAACRSR